MSEPEPFRIFVSYSRRDAHLVVQVVRLLRATHGLVFQDEDSLRAGQPCSLQIDQAIQAAHLVAVFWCEHSNSGPGRAGTEEIAAELFKAGAIVGSEVLRAPSLWSRAPSRRWGPY